MNYSVLLIEDNPSDAARISDDLRKELHDKVDILCCESYEEAFGPLFYKEWNLILINYQLSKRSALDTVRRVKALLKEGTKMILYYTSFPQLDLPKEAHREGVDDLISKDEFSRPEGIARLLSHLDKRLSPILPSN